MVPGLGHLYVDRSKFQNLFFTGLYCFLVYKTIHEYDNFISNRREYDYWQSEYNNLDNTDSNNIYSNYKTRAMNFYNSSLTSRKLFISYLSGAILTNVASTLHLEFKMEWDL